MFRNLLFRSVITIISFWLLVTACEKDKGPLIIKPPPVPGDTMISFKNVIQPIFDSHCITCHNISHIFLDLRADYSWYDLHTQNAHGVHAPYIDTINPENSILIQRLRGVELDIMPPNAAPLPASTVDTVAKWMLQGAKDN